MNLTRISVPEKQQLIELVTIVDTITQGEARPNYTYIQKGRRRDHHIRIWIRIRRAILTCARKLTK